MKVFTTQALQAALFICLFAALPAMAQTGGFPFSIVASQNNSAVSVNNGATVGITSSRIGTPVATTFTITNRGTADAIFNSVGLTGSPDFSLGSLPEFPNTVPTGSALTFSVRYNPTSGNQSVAQLAIPYVIGTASNVIQLALVGGAPDPTFAYTLQTDNNTVGILSGGTVLFPPTQIKGTTAAAFSVINRGTAAFVVRSIGLTGANFELQGLPLLPLTVDTGRELRFTVRYRPQQIEDVSQGELKINANDQDFVFGLSGSAVGAVLKYDVSSGDPDGAVAVAPGQPISFGDVEVNQKKSLSIRVSNSGTADATLNAINLLGQGFQLTGLPFLPVTLVPTASLTFNIDFAPTQIGQVTGQLRVNSDQFPLNGNSLGSQLAYSYSNGSLTVDAQPGSTISFPNTTIGDSSPVSVTIRNNGNKPGIVGVLSAQPPNAFVLVNAPAVPLSLDPGTEATFSVAFRPSREGAASGTLRTDTATFNLAGTALPSPSLPQYQITNLPATSGPLQQPSVGLTLSDAYPLPLSGTLTLEVISDTFTDDPAVQFSSGGRTVKFTIPAGTTQAQFGNGRSEVRIQTGSVAGTLQLTPSFQLQNNTDVTLADPYQNQAKVTIPRSAPQVLAVDVVSRTAQGFELAVTGLSTGRSITKLDLQLTPAANKKLDNTHFVQDVAAAFTTWYNSQTSKNVGSLFTALLPISLQTGDRNADLSNVIDSVSISLGNADGTSSAVTAKIATTQ